MNRLGSLLFLRRVYRQWALLIIAGLTVLLMFVTIYNANIAYAQPTSNRLPYPFSLLPEFNNVELGVTNVQDLDLVLNGLLYRIVLRNAAGMVAEPKYYKGNPQLLNDSMLTVSFSPLAGTLTSANLTADATFRDGVFPRDVWDALSPKTMVERYGPPDAFWMSIGDSAPTFGVGFGWSAIKTVVNYTGVFKPQDVTAEVFKLCPRRDRIPVVQVSSTNDPVTFEEVRTGYKAVSTSDTDKMSFFVNPADRNAQAIGNILLNEGCFATKSTKWRRFSPSLPTWTPWPGYTDTPTPTDVPSATPTSTASFMPTATGTPTPAP